MLSIVPFEARHLEMLPRAKAALSDIEWQLLQEQQYSYTLLHGERAVACAGVVKHWEGRGEGWMFIGPHSRSELMFLCRAVKRFFAYCPFRRVEAVVKDDFLPAHKWVRKFGFRVEGRLRSYSPSGEDMVLYSKIRGH